MNSTRTVQLLITGTVCAAVVTAVGTTVHAETSPPTPFTRHMPNVAITSSTQALTTLATPNTLYAAGSPAPPAGYYVAPVGLGGPDTFSAIHDRISGTRVSNPSLFFAPAIGSSSTSPSWKPS